MVSFKAIVSKHHSQPRSKLIWKTIGECSNQALCIHQTTYWGHKILRMKTPFLPLSQLAGVNTNQPRNRNMLINVKVNIAFTRTFFKRYSMSFLKIFRLIHFALVLLQLLMLQACVIIGIWKMEFFKFGCTERFKGKQNLKNPSLLQLGLYISPLKQKKPIGITCIGISWSTFSTLLLTFLS